jgi:hypothetical protein
VLIPKKENPQRITDYRPISLTHSFAKLITKILANRLGPQLDELISINQSAFIRKRCLHDNFMFMQQAIRQLQRKKDPTLFIKLAISKDFDSVNWPFLIQVMAHLGFGQRWRDWIATLWSTTSSSFLVNGVSGRRILHCRGVRQGDPLSPMLFLLAIEPLHRLFKKAQQMGLLKKIGSCCENFRVSLYADDATLFIKSIVHDLDMESYILEIFTTASGLKTNMGKTEFYPIQCQNMDLSFLASRNLNISTFPCTYLGLPLHFRNPTRPMMQQVVSKIDNRLLGWKRSLLSYPGRETLIKTVLFALPTYFMTVFKLQKWAIARIDRYRRSFLWKGHDVDNVKGGNCLDNWKTCLLPKHLGGLGIKDLENFGRALRLK